MATVIMTTSEGDLQLIVHVTNQEIEDVGLGINTNKTETLVISRAKESASC